MIRIGFLYTRLRVEEKYLLEELEKCSDVEIIRINDGDSFFDIHQLPQPVDVLFERSISYSRGLYISRIFEAQGVPVVNSSLVAAATSMSPAKFLHRTESQRHACIWLSTKVPLCRQSKRWAIPVY
jgi:glutathione synthase/RimK-type ligase-like ATP-grasp enzyme